MIAARTKAWVVSAVFARNQRASSIKSFHGIAAAFGVFALNSRGSAWLRHQWPPQRPF